MASRIVSRSVTVPAPAEAIFDLLASPSGHAKIDGSGTVQGPAEQEQRLYLGATFGMRMRMGLPYRISNEVVEFDKNRRIAWRHIGGHIWRWELEPVEGGTKVTESFDYAPARSPRMLELTGTPRRNAKAIEQTLSNLTALFTGPQAP